MSRPRLLLLLVLGLIAASIYAWYATPRQQRVSETATASKEEGTLGRQGNTAKEVGLDFSGGEKLPFREPRRDLFRPLYRAHAPEPEPVAVTPEPEPAPGTIAPPPLTPAPPPVPRTSGRAIPPLKVLGSLVKDNVRTVFLASVDGTLYLVKNGERFADGLLVQDLTDDKIVIARADGSSSMTLPIGPEKAQRIRNDAADTGRPVFEPVVNVNPNTPEPVVVPPEAADGQKVEQ